MGFNLQQFVKDWGNNPLVYTVIGILLGAMLATLGFFSRKIGRLLGRFFVWLWALVRGQRTDYVFEKRYLDWLIGEYRHLGLLPAQIVARRWKEGQQLVDLEKVYVKLSMSVEGGDQTQAGTYGQSEKSWRKLPSKRFMYFFRWYYRTVFTLIGLGVLVGLIQWIIELLMSGKAPFAAFEHTYLIQFALHYPFYFGPLFIILLGLAAFGFVRNRLIGAERTYESGNLGSVVDRHKRLVIRGDPGSGKTTMLRYLAVTCARTLRKNRHDGDSPKLVKERLLWDIHPFPILVTLRRHGKVTSWDETKEFTDIFLEEIPPEVGNRCPKGFFERHLKEGNCLILLDGFDELGSPEARGAMARRIAGFLEVYDNPGNRVVVTTRIVGYEGQLDRYGFSVRTVHDLKAGEVRALVKQRYRAIALSEATRSQSQEEARAIQQKLLRRSERLIERIEKTPRLAQLATNPMLLSLIVLVHYTKVELPEERILLYRDCVEILTEWWQQKKREEAGLPRKDEELGLNQKLILLQEVAWAMQKQRKEEGSQALLPKNVVQDLIAKKLPEFLSAESQQTEMTKQEFYRRKAEEWIDGIQTESGILVEQGLDESGTEPLVGFSHLTFQEYLAAAALNEEKRYRRLLLSNLLAPAWREVVLLYMALVNDATPLIRSLLEAQDQPSGLLLAGQCLAERLKKVDVSVQQSVLAKLKEGFSQADDNAISDFGNVMARLGRSEMTAFMRTHLNDPMQKKQLVAIKALGQTRLDDQQIEGVRADLVQILDTCDEVDILVAARESLARVDDPRFGGPEPIMVRIPPQSHGVPASPKGWKELRTSPTWANTKTLKRIALIERVVDYWCFIRLHWRRPQSYEFEIGKYLVTNLEYSRFIEATGYKGVPESWVEGVFPPEEATHPVYSITYLDAIEYCKWLSLRSGNKYRLPTEWEWEWAATGPHGWMYPWGDEFKKDKCNTSEGGKGGTTPVGSYKAGVSWYGASDMIGNVWEVTQGYNGVLGTLGTLIVFITAIVSLLTLLLSPSSSSSSSLLVVSLPVLLASLTSLLILRSKIYRSKLKIIRTSGISGAAIAPGLLCILRGGSWRTASAESTCFYRKNYNDELFFDRFIGFRCVREV